MSSQLPSNTTQKGTTITVTTGTQVPKPRRRRRPRGSAAQNANNNRPQNPPKRRRRQARGGGPSRPGSGRNQVNSTRSNRNVANNYARYEANSHLRFAAGLLRPSSLICRKWPQPIPVPTFSTKWSGSFTMTANASGNLVAWLVPPISGTTAPAIQGSNNAAVTILSSSNTWTPSALDNPSFFTNFDSFRMVSGEMKISDTTNLLNRQGKFYVGSIIYSQIASNAFTIAALRDAYHQHNADTQKPLRAIAIPLDTSAGEWVSNIRSWSVPVVSVIGGVASGAYTIDYHFNFEAIPNSANSDLLATEPAQAGTTASALSAVGSALSTGYQAVASTVDWVDTGVTTLLRGNRVVNNVNDLMGLGM